MKKNIFILFFLFSKIISACECPPIEPVSKELCTKYNVIFFGKVDSVSPCDLKGSAIAYFTINELYKGNVEEHVKVNFDCSSACMMSFAKNEQWLIYSSYERFDQLTINICGHSRMKVQEGVQDVAEIAAQRTFDQEKEFLKSILGTQNFIKNNELNKQQAEMRPRNDQPSAMNKLWLLLISFSAMAVVYYFTRNKK